MMFFQRPFVTRLLIVAIAMVIGACGKNANSSSTTKADATSRSAPDTAPTTEEGLVEWVADAIDRKSLDMLGKAVGQEQMADFQREMKRDPAGFWERGAAWVSNVKSGFTVAHRSDGSVKRWKALIKFGNGQRETVIFARQGGRLVFEKL